MRVVVAIVLSLLCHVAWAHKASDSYLALQVRGAEVEGQWDIALRDLDFALGLDADLDGSITWDELRARHDDIAAYALARLSLRADGTDCPAQVTGHLFDVHTDGGYAVLRLRARCADPPAQFALGYRLFFDLDGQHKGLARLSHAAGVQSVIFSAEAREHALVLSAPGAWRQFRDYVRHGVWHIWTGFDHVLFLLSLLLPAVLVRADRRWTPATDFRTALWDVTRVVTAFTAAHSVTLTLSALGVIALPSRPVEAAIAASVVLAALNNVWPVIGGRRWALAFGFGLLHGFGFAGVLADLGPPDGARALALLAFNVGVELGQLALVAAFLPAAWLLRPHWVYRRVVCVAGSVAVAAVALLWCVERAFDLRVLA